MADRFNYRDREHEQSLTVDLDLPLLPLVEEAVEVMAVVLQELPASEEQPKHELLRRAAVFNLSAIAVRSSAALAALLRLGYETEALSLKRRVSECLDRASAVVADKSGEHARQWLEGIAPNPRRVAAKYGSQESFDLLSKSAHADNYGLSYLWSPPPNVPVPPEARLVRIDPFRQPNHANFILWQCAYELGALMAALAEVWKGTVALPTVLSEGLQYGREYLGLAQTPAGPQRHGARS